MKFMDSLGLKQRVEFEGYIFKSFTTIGALIGVLPLKFFYLVYLLYLNNPDMLQSNKIVKIKKICH